jgi:uncharacterized protein (TIGR02246 family)
MLCNAKCQILTALAISALLGYATTSATRAGTLALAQAAGREEVIVFEVRVPADAVLEIDGNKTESTGGVRTFRTPPLPAERHYTYTLKATAQGKEVTRKIQLAHGVDNRFDLRAEFRPPATSKPDSTKLALVGQPKAEPGSAGKAKGDPKEMDAIQKKAEAFVEAFHKGDAEALAAFWAIDGDYTDQTGRHLKGREAIAKAFKELFAEQKGLKVRIDSLSLRFVTPNLAIEDGTSEVFPADGGPPSRARYTNVHDKKDGQWLLSSVREAPFIPPSNYQHLRGLEWAIGNWTGEAEGGGVERLSVAWSDKQNFIDATFTTSINNIPVGGATQRVGWDPEANRIRSWIFDATGGFGEGSWTQDGKKWVVKTTSVLQDGKKAAATYILTPVDADAITLQAKDRSEDGNKLLDTKEVKMKRVK